MRRFQAEQEMHMVSCSANLHWQAGNCSNQSSHVGVETVAPRGCNPRLSIFGCENKMVVERMNDIESSFSDTPSGVDNQIFESSRGRCPRLRSFSPTG